MRAAFGADLADQVRRPGASGLELDDQGEVTRALGDGAALLRALGPGGPASLAAAARLLLERPDSRAGRAATLVLAAGPGEHVKVTLTVQEGAPEDARVLAALARVQPGTEAGAAGRVELGRSLLGQSM